MSNIEINFVLGIPKLKKKIPQKLHAVYNPIKLTKIVFN